METTEQATESCVEPITPFWVAWNVVVPSCKLVTKPVALSVATPGLVELQAAVAVKSRVLPSLYVPVAVSCSLEPKTTFGLEGEMAMEVRAITVNEVEPVTALKVAEIVVVPGPAAVASPVLAPIVATPVLLEFQVALVVRSCVLLSEKIPVAVNCWVAGKITVPLAGVT